MKNSPSLMKIRLATVLFLLIASGSTAIIKASENELYIHKSKLFEVPIPVDKKLGGDIDDNIYSVSFTDDFGLLYKIEAYLMPDEHIKLIKELGLQNFLTSYLDFYLSETIFKVAPKSKVETQKFHSEAFNGYLYSRVYIPNGSVNEVSLNNGPYLRVDDKRSVLIFINKDSIFQISCSLGSMRYRAALKDNEMQKYDGDLKSQTMKFAETIKFTTNNKN